MLPLKLIIRHTAAAEQSYRLYTDFALFNEEWKSTASPRQMLRIHSDRPCHLRKTFLTFPISNSGTYFPCGIYHILITNTLYTQPFTWTLLYYYYYYFLLFLSGLDSLRRLNCLKIKVWLFKDHFLDINFLREIFLNY